MSKNYMEQVARMLGVEMGERFEIKEIADRKFYINENGLQCETNEMFVPDYFNDLVAGKYEMVKITQRKHTGLEDVEAGDCIYRLFDTLSHLTALKKQKLESSYFADKTIRDNWERYIAIKKRLATAASELNTEPIDWNDCRQEKWYICCPDRETLTCYHIDGYPNDGVFFTSKEAAQKAIEIVGEKDLIWMLRDFQPYLGYLVEAEE